MKKLQNVELTHIRSLSLSLALLQDMLLAPLIDTTSQRRDNWTIIMEACEKEI